MMDIASLLSIGSIELPEVILRVAMATLFGFMVGYDRDNKNKPIDFRAYMIICVASCVVAISALEIDQILIKDVPDDFYSFDLSKVFSGVLTGIGFLGAGAIIKRSDDRVIGTATGASIWASGGIGLCIGFGLYAIALIGFAAIFLTLTVGGLFLKDVSGHYDQEKKNKDKGEAKSDSD